ncbi:Phosphatidylethanolamine-binding protein PEBP [Penicillium bovifimosum]|uniref:Phosphatidylethanolamine-binding protein PEBP n=1 Tax=Penicillium bovifimosum TaxID=126998 RepID=A0A9W9GP44_9EURO|nr:Phosphatidylethanolamine-binding protein PEBP [Penicillium bovifimosum]KAJ5125047.1 Phosphatidylethanolamine-binding protein PEBP [Penicillium bovifimosum]
MAILDYLEFIIGRILYPIRGHDSRQVLHCPALKGLPEPNMTLEAPDIGPSGSKLPIYCTCNADDGRGRLPELHWTVPDCHEQVIEYVLLCEDLDPPIPFLVFHHGLIWAIPASITRIQSSDVQPDEHAKSSRLTVSGWRFVPNLLGVPYVGAGAPLGHGKHRYVFTIVALNESLKFTAPEKATKNDIKRAMAGKVVGWGQWTGVFEKPWPL